jgi:argininosuccinate lyase
VPFRVGHAFAAAIVEDARSAGLRPDSYPFARAIPLFQQAAVKHKWSQVALPLKEAEFKLALSPSNMVLTRKGIGGPQPEEVQRMLGLAAAAIDADRLWLSQRRDQLSAAEAKLNTAFARLTP